jgi:predicted DNA-binding transcriptional regulator YafY
VKWLPDGSYQLEVPYSSEKELAMDVLKHGAEVEVVGPKPLREEIARRLKDAAARYGS